MGLAVLAKLGARVHYPLPSLLLLQCGNVLAHSCLGPHFFLNQEAPALSAWSALSASLPSLLVSAWPADLLNSLKFSPIPSWLCFLLLLGVLEDGFGNR